GGLSDRYGYKQTIFLSTVLKIIGYLLMAWFPTYWGFFWGAVVLATGTAIFKPGIQGTLVKSTTRRNSSMAWGIFYQLVNIGGFLGPLVAGLLRKMEWTYVFYACAGIICLNFLLLLTYKEVGKEERLERNRLAREGRLERPNLAKESIQELIKPHVCTSGRTCCCSRASGSCSWPCSTCCRRTSTTGWTRRTSSRRCSPEGRRRTRSSTSS
ncbi:MAG: MFS transporter, partial [Planctomycetota bacterium]